MISVPAFKKESNKMTRRTSQAYMKDFNPSIGLSRSDAAANTGGGGQCVAVDEMGEFAR